MTDHLWEIYSLSHSMAEISSLSLSCTERDSLFWASWIRNTIKNVTMVVPVCQSSEYPNMGPERAQSRTTAKASKKAVDEPAALATVEEKRSSAPLEVGWE